MASAARYGAYRFGSFTLNLEKGALLAADGTELPLRPKSFALLQLLTENAGRLLSRETILETLWPDLFVTEDNVTQCIHDIRTALGPGSQQILRTLPRRGYLFAAEVIRVAATASSGRTVDDAAEHGAATQGRAEGPGAIADTAHAGSQPRPASGTPRLSGLSVAVTSLRNLGVSPAQERLAESLVEDIAAGLSFWGAVVVSHVEDSSGNGNPPGPVAIARTFGVGWVIQGSMRGAINRIELNLQLIDGETGVHLWSERAVIDPAGDPELQAESAARIAWTLYRELARIIDRRIEALPPEAWTANDFAARGRAFSFRPVTAENRAAAIRNYERALALDPATNTARLGLAAVLVMQISDWWGPATTAEEARAEQLLQDILRVDANVSLAHTLMGALRRIQGRLNDSEIALDIAIRLAPNSSNAVAQLGATLICQGKPEAAMPLLERGLRLSPHDFTAPIYHSSLGLCHLLLGNVEAAIASQRTARALNPTMYYTHWGLAAALGLKGELDEANAALKQAIAMRPELVSPPACYVLSQRPAPRFVVLFEKTFLAGVSRAGLPAMAR
ncbi:MAG: winged helix-turn-helix domain-containing protein [Rhodopila sp.]